MVTMADIRLFRLSKDKTKEIAVKRVPLEKEVQNLIEKNLLVFFGIHFLASEYSTGEKHKGRIDTLGLDENNSPVIVEFKLHTNENVINQGLYYMDWLFDHKAEFEKMVTKKFGKDIEIEWQAPRLLCIADDFTKYDSYAVEQINRNIELIRYKIYEEDLILFELVNAISVEEGDKGQKSKKKLGKDHKGNEDYVKQAPEELRKLWDHIDAHLLSIGDDVQKKQLKFYMAYRRLKNFLCMEMRPQAGHIFLYLKLDYTDLINPPKFVRDVSNVGHFGTGDVEAKIKTAEEFKEIEPLVKLAYQAV